ncbi:hypothetical protein XBJ2_500018 [Xenorhabdus bovienii str. Jollieti]|uniref:Transposase n=1 Tax=Xenorhabdus bovienii (strain SS-2004) TaxID=406818 RepID=D3V017_XENBS|nr:hypothetical protein [Xenorhabdus bovienii]CBJ80310.1 hypothetical protein XBJ1_1176 [Xenorhabdus bovienii SS-2004]CDH30043.1 hypothetical protein XBJ2_500018 [Xenorhabdus bovienii str. Jollieti]
MNKRNLTRAQSWGCLAVRENRSAAWTRGMKLLMKYYGGHHANIRTIGQ